MEILISFSHEFLSRVNNYFRFYGDAYCIGKSWFIKILNFLYFKGIDALDENFSSEDFLAYGIIVMNTWLRLYNNWYRSFISVQSQEMLGSSPCGFGGGGYSTTYRYMHVQLLKWCMNMTVHAYTYSSFINLLDEADWEADPAVQEMLHQTSRRSSTSRYVINCRM